MRKILKRAALVALAVPAVAAADTVRLRSGEVVEGDVRDLGDRVEVVSKTGSVSLRWTDVDVVLHGKSARDVYRERRGAVGSKDAKALYALALWAGRSGLAEERKACLADALAADPQNEAVRQELGQQKSGDRWLDGAALLEAKGFVGKDGAWVLKEEAALTERRAEAAKGLLAPEKRAEELLAKAAEGGTARKFALEALAGLDETAVRRPALRTLRRGEPAARAAAALALANVHDRDVLRPLIGAAVLDRDATVRAAAVASLKAIGDPDVVKAIAKAMWSSVPELRMNAAQALGDIGGVQAVDFVIRRVMSSGGPGPRVNFFAGTQTSYISDFDVEIAQASQIGDPIVGTIREGVLLDTRVMSVREEWTEVERRVYYRSLAQATGKDFGQDPVAWKKWFDDEGRAALVASTR